MRSEQDYFIRMELANDYPDHLVDLLCQTHFWRQSGHFFLLKHIVLKADFPIGSKGKQHHFTMFQSHGGQFLSKFICESPWHRISWTKIYPSRFIPAGGIAVPIRIKCTSCQTISQVPDDCQ